MEISDPEQALSLPVGKLEVVDETRAGRVCRICSFTSDEVVNIAGKLLERNIELVEFASQAEIVAYMTNRYGWKDYGEAFAI
ncbi:hypothetical protein [Bradyrhizobium elkanii]